MYNARDHLLGLLQKHPDARIVSDAGASLFSGWADLKECKYHSPENAIELIFE
jgi:hypothetical protein